MNARALLCNKVIHRVQIHKDTGCVGNFIVINLGITTLCTITFTKLEKQSRSHGFAQIDVKQN